MIYFLCAVGGFAIGFILASRIIGWHQKEEIQKLQRTLEMYRRELKPCMRCHQPSFYHPNNECEQFLTETMI